MARKEISIRNVIKKHVVNNSKEYIITALIFVTGIFLGVLFVNNVQEAPKNDIVTYFNSFIEKLKTTDSLNNLNLFKTSIIKNTLLAISLWFFGTTIIGIPVVFGLVLYRGFCLGYTISVSVSIMGCTKGTIFILIALLLQNLLYIPAILALSVSGMKLYKSITKDKGKDNIKLEVVRHTAFSIIMLIVLVLSSFIDIYISTNALKYLIKYF